MLFLLPLCGCFHRPDGWQPEKRNKPYLWLSSDPYSSGNRRFLLQEWPYRCPKRGVHLSPLVGRTDTWHCPYGELALYSLQILLLQTRRLFCLLILRRNNPHLQRPYTLLPEISVVVVPSW